MKVVKVMLVVISVSLLSLSRCQKEDVGTSPVDIAKCDLSSKFDFLQKIDDKEGIVEQYIIDPNGDKIVTYVIKCASVPTGYLAICNLPEEFKQIGVQLKFSAAVYQPKNMAFVNLNAVPAELTSVQKVTPKN